MTCRESEVVASCVVAVHLPNIQSMNRLRIEPVVSQFQDDLSNNNPSQIPLCGLQLSADLHFSLLSHALI